MSTHKSILYSLQWIFFFPWFFFSLSCYFDFRSVSINKKKIILTCNFFIPFKFERSFFPLTFVPRSDYACARAPLSAVCTMQRSAIFLFISISQQLSISLVLLFVSTVHSNTNRSYLQFKRGRNKEENIILSIFFLSCCACVLYMATRMGFLLLLHA